jgi:hypothetical protein
MLGGPAVCLKPNSACSNAGGSATRRRQIRPSGSLCTGSQAAAWGPWPGLRLDRRTTPSWYAIPAAVGRWMVEKSASYVRTVSRVTACESHRPEAFPAIGVSQDLLDEAWFCADTMVQARRMAEAVICLYFGYYDLRMPSKFAGSEQS